MPNAALTKRLLWTSAAVAVLLTGGLYVKAHYVGALPLRPGEALDAPAPMATWPWPKAKVTKPHLGETHWVDRSSPDGTILHLFEFDFTKNPHLRLELFDQDQDDAHPFDNSADYWTRSAATITHQLNQEKKGQVLAAWNGLFFDMDHSVGGPHGVAHHVTPNVLNGVPRYNVGNHRWLFGVQYNDGRPTFKTIHEPDKATIAREFTYGAGGAQCLIYKGKPLLIHPYPGPNDPPEKQPVPSTSEEIGHIPVVDHIKTTRMSMGWSRDSQKFYLLYVLEPDTESGSIFAFRQRIPVAGGWMVSDLQKFWEKRGVWGAVNSDAGDVAQLTALRADGQYQYYPPAWVTMTHEYVCAPDLHDAPQGGGTLMYFYVRDSG